MVFVEVIFVKPSLCTLIVKRMANPRMLMSLAARNTKNLNIIAKIYCARLKSVGVITAICRHCKTNVCFLPNSYFYYTLYSNLMVAA